MKQPLSILLSLLMWVLCFSGCETAPPRKTLPPLRIQTATLEELTAKINASSEAMKTLKTTLSIRVREKEMDGVRECQGLLAYEKPSNLYLKGYRPLIPTFFTLVSKNGEFWVHVPKENRVLTGRVSDLNESDNLQMGIRPDDLLRTLNIHPIPASTTHVVEIQEASAQYILSVFRTDGTDKFLERQIWIERYFLNVEREIYYNAYGVVEVDISRKDYVNEGPVYFPQEMVIFRPDRGTSLFLRANKLLINPELKQDLFEFQMPGGATVETLKKEPS